MDQALLRTFLEVARARHFGRAAAALCITQSAVSARIKQLESTLSVELFNRRRNDIQLTAAGQRLHWHAELILRNWERACLDVVQNGRAGRVLALGCSPDLWPLLARDWIARLDPASRGLGLRLELLSSADLSKRLQAGLLDLVLGFESICDADLESAPLGSIALELMSDRPGSTADEALAEGYIQIEWGSAFTIAQASDFPHAPPPSVRVSHALVAVDLLERLGGAAYLPRQLAQPLLGAGRLFPVAEAPVYHRPVYARYRPGGIASDIVRENSGLEIVREEEDR